eukprot:3633979-Pyramimonas_sp.AAC.1
MCTARWAASRSPHTVARAAARARTGHEQAAALGGLGGEPREGVHHARGGDGELQVGLRHAAGQARQDEGDQVSAQVERVHKVAHPEEVHQRPQGALVRRNLRGHQHACNMSGQAH